MLQLYSTQVVQELA